MSGDPKQDVEQAPIASLKGIGPARQSMLQELGIATVGDLLWWLPRRWLTLSPWATASDGDRVLVEGTVRRAHRLPGTPRRTTVEVQVEDGVVTGHLFGQRMVPGSGAAIRLVGTRRGDQCWSAEVASHDIRSGLLPVYRSRAGLAQHVWRLAIRGALAYARRGEHPLAEAFCAVHDPFAADDVERGLEALRDAEATSWAQAIAAHTDRSDNAWALQAQVPDDAIRSLPYALSDSQSRAVSEIVADLRQPVAMRRLLLGDVGSGKTVVLALAALSAVRAGGQVLWLEPTVALAHQVFEASRGILGAQVGLRASGLSLGCGTPGSQPAAIVATAEGLERLPRLALRIADEEQRFGLLRKEGTAVHTLLASATPVPRSFVLAVLGQQAVSELESRFEPPVSTVLLTARRRREVYARLAESVRSGGQVISVCPSLTARVTAAPSAQALAQWVRRTYPDVTMEVVHGRMASADWIALLQRLRAGEALWISATSTVEVGIDLPHLRIVVVEGASRFGLASLHQLRGRLGRHGVAGTFVMIEGGDDTEALERLRFICRSRDGRAIAEQDLRLRGPSSLLGDGQHGLPPLRALRWPDDAARLREALRVARKNPG